MREVSREELLIKEQDKPEPSIGELREALRFVRQCVRGHGGDVEITGIKDGVVEVSFERACRSCALKSVTFALAVQPALDQLSGVVEVISRQVSLPKKTLGHVKDVAEGRLGS